MATCGGLYRAAVRDNPGRVAACEGGTLFLDEIGDLPPLLQPKLLRFIQDHEYEHVGEAITRRANVRVITATNVDLEAAVKAGRFREDLFYRLNVVELRIPPLRDRPQDILPLAERFLATFAIQSHKTLAGFTDRAMQIMEQNSWPGNVRELRNCVERGAIFCEQSHVDVEHLGLQKAAESLAGSWGSGRPWKRWRRRTFGILFARRHPWRRPRQCWILTSPRFGGNGASMGFEVGQAFAKCSVGRDA